MPGGARIVGDPKISLHPETNAWNDASKHVGQIYRHPTKSSIHPFCTLNSVVGSVLMSQADAQYASSEDGLVKADMHFILIMAQGLVSNLCSSFQQ